METVKASNRVELKMWQELQRRFKVSMGQYESEVAKIHANACTRKPGRCRCCIFKTKVVLLEEELSKMVEKMEIA